MFSKKEKQTEKPKMPLEPFSQSKDVFVESLSKRGKIEPQLLKLSLSGVLASGHQQNIEPTTLYEEVTNLTDQAINYYDKKKSPEGVVIFNSLKESYQATLDSFSSAKDRQVHKNVKKDLAKS